MGANSNALVILPITLKDIFPSENLGSDSDPIENKVSIQTQELIAQSNQFLNYLQNTQHKSDYTLVAYRSDLVRFLKYFARVGKDLSAYDQHTFSTYVAELAGPKSRQLSAISKKRVLYALRHFLWYLHVDLEVLARDISDKVSVPKGQSAPPNFLTHQELESLISAIEVGKKNRNGLDYWLEEVHKDAAEVFVIFFHAVVKRPNMPLIQKAQHRLF